MFFLKAKCHNRPSFLIFQKYFHPHCISPILPSTTPSKLIVQFYCWKTADSTKYSALIISIHLRVTSEYKVFRLPVRQQPGKDQTLFSEAGCCNLTIWDSQSTLDLLKSISQRQEVAVTSWRWAVYVSWLPHRAMTHLKPCQLSPLPVIA